MIRNRMISLMVALVLLAGCFAGCGQTPQATEPEENTNIFDRNLPYPKGTEGLAYEKNGDSYTVTGMGTATDKDVVIPAEYNGLPVTAVANEAFYDNKVITSVTIPPSITSLGRAAFFNSHNMNAVYIWDLTAWCGIQFSSQGNPLDQCKNLYYQDTLVTHLIIPDTVTAIPDNAFNWCQSLERVTIGSSVTEIGVGAFESCFNLQNVTIGDNVQTIGKNAFASCQRLQSLHIPASVTSLGSFYMNDGLTQIHITDLAAWCKIQFGGAAPGSLYLNGELITELVIPNTVQEISDRAFYGQTGFKVLRIPATVTKIGSFAFFKHEITTVYFDGTLAQWEAIEKGRDWDYAPHSYTLVCTDGEQTVTPQPSN